ncbi:hypothetical protein HN512_04270 [Candidatus Peregrinibacteria bacterium]|jgi:hypothetical protein|nr:hypothetical protein [Candidatus Peregrinibacteria bacterium]MBT3599025.1 hypothetical protein [Candidatus Peregrinibacteria bacterium]MBT4585922.1 hypothetical protein [Candidatus Peregrinibacteria bacterium]MBT6730669.1 hypothetical protein [Candidatus Peregrinibacteria bacterium]MBT7009152.1 hypothetical protein [Candidatus Peregrinibacteria bacterium]
MLFRKALNTSGNRKFSISKENRLLCFAKNEEEDEIGNESNESRKEENPLEAISDISDSIRGKAGILTPQEIEEMLKHPSSLLALLEYDNEDLRIEVEQEMRLKNPEYYGSESDESLLPIYEILRFLKSDQGESKAEEIEEKAVERLQTSTDSLMQFSNRLETTLKDIKDIEESLRPDQSGIRIGNIDIERLKQIESKILKVCLLKGLKIGKANLNDWINGRYDSWKPTKDEIEETLNYITENNRPLPKKFEIDTSETSDPDLWKKYEELRLESSDAEAALKDNGVLSKMFSSAKRAITRRRNARMRLDENTSTEEEVSYSSQDLSEQISALETDILESRKMILAQIQEKAEELYRPLKEEIGNRFEDTSSENVLDEFGMSQSLLAGTAVAGALQQLENILFTPTSTDSDEFPYFARLAIQDLEDMESSNILETQLNEARAAHKDTISWTKYLNGADTISNALEILNAGGGENIVLNEMSAEAREFLNDILPRIARIAKGTATDEDFNFIEQEIPNGDKRSQFALMLEALTNESLRAKLETVSAEDKIKTPFSAEELEKIEAEFAEVKEQLDSGVVQEALNHPNCRVLHIGNEGMNQHFGNVETAIISMKNGTETEEAFKYARDTINRLKQTSELLTGISYPSFIVREKVAPEVGTVGYYSRKNGNIIIFPEEIERSTRTEEEVIHHEKGHAILDILTRQTGLFAGIHLRTANLLSETIPSDQAEDKQDTFRALLHNQADRWGVSKNKDIIKKRIELEESNPEKAKQRTEEEFEIMLMDELICKFADWNEGISKSATAEEIVLFKHVFNEMKPDGESKISEELLNTSELADEKLYLQLDDDGNPIPGTEDNDDGSGSAIESMRNVDVFGELRMLRNDTEKIKEFWKAFPSYKSQLVPAYDNYNEISKEIEEKMQKGEVSEQDAVRSITKVKEHLKHVLEELDDIKYNKSSVADAAMTGRQGWNKLFDRVQFMSLKDVWMTIKNGAEDIKRVWERRGAAKQAQFGLGITKWIPEWVPYLGRMQNEFLRRDKDAETKEVNEWKEKFSEVDSLDLQKQLRHANNPDQIKAIFFVLTERGRLDWNDSDMWKTLNRLSQYSMPIGVCKTDDVLRDKWLQKLISEIWDDKDLYTSWRQTNDSATDTGKKSFTPMVDQLANVGDHLNGELKNQLILYDEWKKTGESSPELNPHLYEEILDYSMRNGKMTMEGKLYYLIQGVATGILSIDRLRTLAGEKGGVLNMYPWLDYFYKKNNSLTEVQALAHRLTEPDKGPYEYGQKTTLWLHLENMRTESTRQRISKAISGGRAEELDHEDIPTLVSQANHKDIERMTGMISGTREKLSPEAVKNTYTGFGTKFKIMAMLLEYEEKEGVKAFTEKDLHDTVKSIVAYIHMDNVFTRNASSKDKSTLTWDEMDNLSGPSTSTLTVSDYRTPQNSFVADIMRSNELDNIEWDDFEGITKEDVIRGEGLDDKSVSRKSFKEKEQIDRSSIMINSLYDKLEAALMEKPELVKKMLRKYAHQFNEENYCSGVGVDPKGQYLNYEVMKSFMGGK